MPTLQEDREQYNSNIKGNMDFLLHGETSEVAKSGLQKARDYKTDSADNRRNVGAAQNSAQSGLNRAQTAQPQTKTATTANTYSAPRSSYGAAATDSTATAHRSNALRAEPTQNYRVKFESGANHGAAVSTAPSDYDSINNTIRNNPRHLGTPILGDAAATTAERRAYSREAQAAFNSVTSRTAVADDSLRAKDITPNAALNRTLDETVTVTPSSNTMGYERIVISNEAVKESREAGIRSEREKEEEATNIPTQVKVVAAIIAAAIILAFTVIFINSALLNSLDVEIDELSTQLETLVTSENTLTDQITAATSEETIVEYAKEAGMIYVGE